jgi:hypothetical protein
MRRSLDNLYADILRGINMEPACSVSFPRHKEQPQGVSGAARGTERLVPPWRDSEGPACRAGFPTAQRTTAGSEWSRGIRIGHRLAL